MTNRSKGLLFVKDPDRGLGEFEDVLNDDEVTLWTIPPLSDHVGFLRLQNENRSFALQRPDRGQRLDTHHHERQTFRRSVRTDSAYPEAGCQRMKPRDVCMAIRVCRSRVVPSSSD